MKYVLFHVVTLIALSTDTLQYRTVYMHKTKALLFIVSFFLVAGCSPKTRHQPEQNVCVIKMDTPEGNQPGKIDQVDGISPECRAVEKSISKAI
ncbi:thiamine biosynthesis protein ApbE [Morganella morganii]|uniref:thiamine biosynthesis protein ApbE n=1 Tax=Morganella morganii TaxID=582 RepID=UPI001F443F72|nr:thiamine biosynthesis protein ApbE [Morganella morganii]